MRLLDEPLETAEISNEVESIKGNINRICVSNNPEEIVSSLGFAIDRLSMLAYSRLKELTAQTKPARNKCKDCSYYVKGEEDTAWCIKGRSIVRAKGPCEEREMTK